MKKFLILPLFLLVLSATSFASNKTSVFETEEAEMTSQLAQLTTIENYVTANPGIMLSEISAPLNIDASLLSSMNLRRGEQVLGIPSFLWGCVGGIAGVAVVYFVGDQDRDETKKALWGCITSTVVWTVLFLTVFAASTTVATY